MTSDESTAVGGKGRDGREGQEDRESWEVRSRGKVGVAEAVSAANALTARWAAAWDGGSTVMSGAGLFPLLAILADAAHREARAELAAAISAEVGEGTEGANRGTIEAARAVLGILQESPGLSAALGLWTAERLPVHDRWLDRLPIGSHEVLDEDPDVAQAALDAWTEKQTYGQLRTMPVSVDADTLLLLASALTVRTRWRSPFTDGHMVPEVGPWADCLLESLTRSLDLGHVVIADSADMPTAQVTLVTVEGEGEGEGGGEDEIDVVLAMGEEEACAGTILATGVAAIGPAGTRRGRPVDLSLDTPGPGLSVTDIGARLGAGPTGTLQTIRFDIAAHHDLLASAELLGLETASRQSEEGWFPAISDLPLRVQAAAQDATATFSADGFVSAAITAVAMMVGSAMPRFEGTVRHLTARFDRPFGFLAVHRASGLIITCGWVAPQVERLPELSDR